ncbi:MAG: hypothetical protein A3H93_10335 [Rhodocyclales bacterium RIFCSPLOWO2_02_FULL_63_24]|nr:MAG: hypothetical protein A3H93_10335 [Rhodocyclales bacterium RIFCSPLOWO2_02_FULL_63_24]
MDHEVSVVLKNGERYDIPLGADDLAAFDAAGARHWIAEAFQAAGLETPNPMGKLLLVDQILLLAQNFKPADYKPLSPEVHRFLCAALLAMGRPSLTIDLVTNKL